MAGHGRFSRRDLACALVLALVIAASWCLAYGRTSVEAWATPISYRGDALFLLSYLKAARDGHVLPGASLEVPELNAPLSANWNDHPRTLRLVFLLAGLVARRAGLFVTINALLLLAHLLAGLSLFFVARRLGARLEWAALGGLAFGLAHFLFWRSLDHLDLALAWHVPLCILVITWAMSRRGVALRSRRFGVAAAVTVVTGLHNPYYACLFAQFLLFAALAQALRPGARRLACAPLLLTGLLAATFLLDDAGSVAYQWAHGLNAAAARPYGNLERYALKPIELLIPSPGSGLGNWGRVAHVYWDGRLYRGEDGSPYLGIVGGGALLWLGWLSVSRLLRRPAQPPPAAAAAIAWIVAFSMLGGANGLVGTLGFVWLRGTNRFSVWILAFSLLFLVTRRVARGRAGLLVAGLLAALAVADQLPRRCSRDEIVRTQLAVAADAHFVATLEKALPPGAMLFMMPLIEFPEGRPVLGVAEYDHLRPYLHSNGLRFSFGTDKGRRREAWQLEVVALPVPRMLQALEGCGFDGILLDRRAYPAKAEGILADLREAGRFVRVVQAGGDYVLVRLEPGSPRLAVADAPDRSGTQPDADAPVCGLTRLAASGG